MNKRCRMWAGFPRVITMSALMWSVFALTFAKATTVEVTAAGDSFMRGGNANTAYNTEKLQVGRYTANDWYRSLLTFDLPAIPAGAVVIGVTLDLTVSTVDTGSTNASAGVEGMRIYELTRDATEAATWNKYDGSSAWTTPGGDYKATPLSTIVAPPNPPSVSVGQNFHFVSSSDFIAAVNSNLADGVLQLIVRTPSLETATATRAFYVFGSSETNVAYRPKLTIQYANNEPVVVHPLKDIALQGGTSSNQNQNSRDHLLAGSYAAAGPMSSLVAFDFSNSAYAGRHVEAVTIDFYNDDSSTNVSGGTVLTMAVNQYNYDFTPTSATYAAPAIGDTTPGGTLGTAFGTLLGDGIVIGGDGSLLARLPSSTALEQAVQAALQSRGNFRIIMSDNTPSGSAQRFVRVGRSTDPQDTPVTMTIWLSPPRGTVVMIR